MNNFNNVYCTDIFKDISHGEKITKFIARDSGAGDLAVEIHGFYDEQGKFYITSESISEATNQAPQNGGE